MMSRPRSPHLGRRRRTRSSENGRAPSTNEANGNTATPAGEEEITTLSLKFSDLSPTEREHVLYLLSTEFNYDHHGDSNMSEGDPKFQAISTSSGVVGNWGPFEKDHPLYDILSLSKRLDAQRVRSSKALAELPPNAQRTPITVNRTHSKLLRLAPPHTGHTSAPNRKNSRSRSRSRSAEGRTNWNRSVGWTSKLVEEFLGYIAKRRHIPSEVAPLDVLNEFLGERCGLPSLTAITAKELMHSTKVFETISPQCFIFRVFIAQEHIPEEDLEEDVVLPDGKIERRRRPLEVLQAEAISKLNSLGQVYSCLLKAVSNESQRVEGADGATHIVPRKYISLRHVPQLVRSLLAKATQAKAWVVEWLEDMSIGENEWDDGTGDGGGTGLAFDFPGHVDAFELACVITNALWTQQRNLELESRRLIYGENDASFSGADDTPFSPNERPKVPAPQLLRPSIAKKHDESMQYQQFERHVGQSPSQPPPAVRHNTSNTGLSFGFDASPVSPLPTSQTPRLAAAFNDRLSLVARSSNVEHRNAADRSKGSERNSTAPSSKVHDKMKMQLPVFKNPPRQPSPKTTLSLEPPRDAASKDSPERSPSPKRRASDPPSPSSQPPRPTPSPAQQRNETTRSAVTVPTSGRSTVERQDRPSTSDASRAQPRHMDPEPKGAPSGSNSYAASVSRQWDMFDNCLRSVGIPPLTDCRVSTEGLRTYSELARNKSKSQPDPSRHQSPSLSASSSSASIRREIMSPPPPVGPAPALISPPRTTCLTSGYEHGEAKTQELRGALLSPPGPTTRTDAVEVVAKIEKSAALERQHNIYSLLPARSVPQSRQSSVATVATVEESESVPVELVEEGGAGDRTTRYAHERQQGRLSGGSASASWSHDRESKEPSPSNIERPQARSTAPRPLQDLQLVDTILDEIASGTAVKRWHRRHLSDDGETTGRVDSKVDARSHQLSQKIATYDEETLAQREEALMLQLEASLFAHQELSSTPLSTLEELAMQ